jgi:hypothetical protein
LADEGPVAERLDKDWVDGDFSLADLFAEAFEDEWANEE